MKNAIKTVAAHAYSTRATALKGLYFAGLIFLAGCSSLQPSPRPLVYDFGPGAQPAASAKSGVAVQDLPAVTLAEVEAPSSLDTAAVVYRLAYSDPQQLRPYGLARWSMPPSQLLRQRLRETLGQRRAVLDPAQGVLGPEGTLTVRLELLEFSQVFTTPQDSSGVVRVRATLSQPAATGERLVAQADFVTRRASSSADASGGVRALTQASDAVVQEVDTWLQKHPKALPLASRP
jgi:cholesterol transport system auxiliary component